MNNSNIVLFALLFLLLKSNVIDVTQMLIFLSLVSYTCGGLDFCGNRTAKI
ncbi:MAG: hypothetical protein MJ072_05930 [Clostridia bacterium]|nr:hypothetical protein [Clostridia bacterium]